MRSPRYPLEPLAQLRDRKVDAAAREQAAAVRKRMDAEGHREQAQRRQEEHDEAAARVRDAELAALSRGELRAGDLARAASWGALSAAEGRALAAAASRATALEKLACDVESEAVALVASRKADAELVAKDRARWEKVRREDLEAKEEEALSEACRPKR